ncbi:MAG TPA: tRNA epoxyqueuosine(34) reductase QueG [Terriglobales bacterium]|nr:tRNA epoxyqueuosine(34) reductase QueG [Terriglobales bacterium]
MPTPARWRELAQQSGRALGFDRVGVAAAAPSARLAWFGDWLASGAAGKMHYLARRDEQGQLLRADIRTVWPWARSVLCAAVLYNAPLPRSTEVPTDGGKGWISRYAWGDDYHDVLRGKLKAWIEELRRHAGVAEQFQATVDTAPLIERDAARQAGLGWQGKNTCLIHQELGSYFFLGTVVTSIEMAPDIELPDRCGSCTRCLDACPTDALKAYSMDASRCLAYLNIELRGTIPGEFRAPMGNNVLGCDICQDVCPWNRRAPTTSAPEFQPRLGLLAPDLEELAALSEAEYQATFRRSAVKRAKYAGLRRNIAVAMGNSGNLAHLPRLQQWAADADPVLAEHAAWALRQIRCEHDDTTSG